MRRISINRLATRSLLAASALTLTTALLTTVSLAQADKADPPPAADAASPQADAEETVQVVSAPEPARILGTVYKIDADAKVVGILVKQGRAYKKFKLVMDDKSRIVVGGQPSDLTALSEGNAVEVAYWKKGKQEVVDKIVVN